MKIKFKCGCGQYNHNIGDWTAHWKYSEKGKIHAIKLFLQTRIEVLK